jgi:plasmid stabilization system protein ParE
MTRLSSTANRQYLDLIDHYLSRGFHDAAVKLTEAVEQAVIAIGQDPMAGRDYPAIYDKLIWPDVKWIKRHRYWFSYTTQGEPVIFNILWDAADIAGRAMSPDDR